MRFFAYNKKHRKSRCLNSGGIDGVGLPMAAQWEPSPRVTITLRVACVIYFVSNPRVLAY